MKKVIEVIEPILQYLILNFILIILITLFFNFDNNYTTEFISTSEYQILLSEFLFNSKVFLGLILLYFVNIKYINKYFKDNKEKSIDKKINYLLLGSSISIIYNIVFYLLNHFELINIIVNTYSNLFIPIVAIGIIGPVCEEFIFRGIAYNKLKKYFKVEEAIIIISLIFMLVHFNVYQIINTLVISLVITYFYEIKKSILAAILIHVGFNITSILLRYIFALSFSYIHVILFTLSIVYLIYFIKYSKIPFKINKK